MEQFMENNIDSKLNIILQNQQTIGSMLIEIANYLKETDKRSFGEDYAANLLATVTEMVLLNTKIK